MRLLGIAAGGIQSQQKAMDVLANNISNVNTVGFKESTVSFAETLTSQQRENIPGEELPETALMGGNGSYVRSIDVNFRQGNLVATDSPYDLIIEGGGFFQVQTPQGLAYTRNGKLTLDANHQLVDTRGNLISPPITIPEGATQVTIQPNGQVVAMLPAEEKDGAYNGLPMTPDGAIPAHLAEEQQVLGQIKLYTAVNPNSLSQGEGTYFYPSLNGTLQEGNPGDIGYGALKSGYLEQSNVNLAASMTQLIQTQRLYQANARLVSNADKMWGEANNLRQ